MATIGLKIANGEFYSIAEENSTVKKRLILTTVHDNQRSVQIDLYRSSALSMADAQYIGSLVVENIKPRPKGEPSIEMVLSSSESGDITADAIDLDTGAGGEHQVLSVSLKSLDQDNRVFEIPDFELEQNEEPPSGLYSRATEVKDKEKKKGSAGLVVVLVGLILILGLAAVWFFLLGGKEKVFYYQYNRPAAENQVKPPVPKTATPEPAPTTPEPKPAPEPVAPPPPPPPAPVAQPPAPPPVIQAPVTPPPARAQQPGRVRPPAPVSSYKVPATIPPEGAPYKLRWGDTLWDISEAFYRNPWLYPRIARFNNIRNPDLIISGTTIRVPPKN